MCRLCFCIISWCVNNWTVCVCVTGVFPEPEIDPVIQIASMVQRQGEKEPFIRTVFTLQSCASIVGSQILCFTQEKQLLQVHTHRFSELYFKCKCTWCNNNKNEYVWLSQSWAEFVRTVDPDIITGYNIQNFDLPYLLNRAATLKATCFYMFSFLLFFVFCDGKWTRTQMD